MDTANQLQEMPAERKSKFEEFCKRLNIKDNGRFGGKFYIISEVTKIQKTENAGWDMENIAIHTSASIYNDIVSLWEYNESLKVQAVQDRKRGITTKFRVIACTALDNENRIKSVRNQKEHGLGDWEVKGNENND